MKERFKLVAVIEVDSLDENAYDLALEYALDLTHDAPVSISFVSGPDILNLDDSEPEESI